MVYGGTTGFQDTLVEEWNISEEEMKRVGKKLFNADHLSESGKWQVVRKIANKRIKEKLAQITLVKIAIGILFTCVMYLFFYPYSIIPTLIFFALGYAIGILTIEPGWYRHRKDMFKHVGKEGNDYVDIYYWGSSI